MEPLEALTQASGLSIAEVLSAKHRGALAYACLRDYVVCEQPGRPARLDELWIGWSHVVADALGQPRWVPPTS